MCAVDPDMRLVKLLGLTSFTKNNKSIHFLFCSWALRKDTWRGMEGAGHMTGMFCVSTYLVGCKNQTEPKQESASVLQS